MRYSLAFLSIFAGCTIQFDVTSQRTALENQILGTHKELDQDVVLISSVRAVDKDGSIKSNTFSTSHEMAVKAKQNQAYNQDDIKEFKDKQYVGENNDGLLEILPPGTGLIESINRRDKKILKVIVAEENRDRGIIWNRIITMNPELGKEHYTTVVDTFKKQNYENGNSGYWYKRNGKWTQKP